MVQLPTQDVHLLAGVLITHDQITVLGIRNVY